MRERRGRQPRKDPANADKLRFNYPPRCRDGTCGFCRRCVLEAAEPPEDSHEELDQYDYSQERYPWLPDENDDK